MHEPAKTSPDRTPPRVNEIPTSGSAGEERLHQAEVLEGHEPPTEATEPGSERSRQERHDG